MKNETRNNLHHLPIMYQDPSQFMGHQKIKNKLASELKKAKMAYCESYFFLMSVRNLAKYGK